MLAILLKWISIEHGVQIYFLVITSFEYDPSNIFPIFSSSSVDWCFRNGKKRERTMILHIISICAVHFTKLLLHLKEKKLYNFPFINAKLWLCGSVLKSNDTWYYVTRENFMFFVRFFFFFSSIFILLKCHFGAVWIKWWT